MVGFRRPGGDGHCAVGLLVLVRDKPVKDLVEGYPADRGCDGIFSARSAQATSGELLPESRALRDKWGALPCLSRDCSFVGLMLLVISIAL
jgi:hypothetical protein